MNNNATDLMNASEIISATTGIIDIEASKVLRDINSRINTKTTRLGEIVSDLAVMVKRGFFTAFGEYIDGKAWMNYDGKRLTRYEIEKSISEYNELTAEKNDLVQEIEELKNTATSFKIPKTYLDLMEEV